MTPDIKEYSTSSQALLGGLVKGALTKSGGMAKLQRQPKVQTFGSRLRTAREAMGLSQEQLGEVLGVTKSQVSYYESDKDRMSYDSLILAAQTLRKTPNYLLTGTEGAEGEMIDPETYKLLVKVKELPEALQEFIYEAIRLAESTKHLIPPKFVAPPDKETWQEFQAYLTRLSKTLPPDQPSPPADKPK